MLAVASVGASSAGIAKAEGRKLAVAGAVLGLAAVAFLVAFPVLRAC